MRRKNGIPWRTAGLLAAVLVIVAFPYIVTLSSARSAQRASASVNHSNAVKAVTYQLAYLARDSEAAIYRLLAGDSDDVVKKRAHAVDAVPGLMRTLRVMTRENPEQQVQVGRLETTLGGRITLLEQANAKLQKGDHAGARNALRDAGDLFQISDKINAIEQIEDSLLDERLRAVAVETRNGWIVLTITSLAQFLLLTIIVLMSERQIGRRRVAETRESRAVERSQIIVQAVREPIALFDERLNSLLVNPAFSELYGDGSEMRGVPLAAMGDGAWADDVLLQRLKDVLARDRELWDHDAVQRAIDGVERHVVINARRLQQQDNDAPALLVTVNDVTVRALAERKVSELNRQLEGKVAQISDVNRELEAFSYSVSHDLRAPLRHISGFARKLESHLGAGVDEKAKHYIDVVAESAQRMAQLIDDLLVFSRLGRGALRLHPVDMQSLVEEARSLAEMVEPIHPITWVVAPLPIVVGDENMLRTVWQNLISNAVKYTGHTESARIEISVKQNAYGDYEFTVSDNGAGFDMQYADKLFGVFQRLHRTSEFPGNGIGLANVQRIIARHGGRIWAEGEQGVGAHFHFSLPATDLAAMRD